jgi:ATP-citrate lyase beta-subunit
MAQVGIREFHAKKLLATGLSRFSENIDYSGEIALVTPETDFNELANKNPWLKNTELVAKPDQLFGKRGKHGLIGLKLSLKDAESWITEKSSAPVTIGNNTGKLTHFVLEPFTPHEKEYYVSIQSEREGDVLSFSYEGGVEVEENWEKVSQLKIGALETLTAEKLDTIIKPGDDAILLKDFLQALHKFYREYNFAFLEINPFAIVDQKIVPLDMVAKLDDTAAFESAKDWGAIEFPSPFGKELAPAEKHIKSLDETTGASLKLTVLNPKGKVWTMVAGGGASVIYADTVSDLGFGQELANYGEYSGDPSTELTRAYAETILDLMTKEQVGKVLVIGGGIANFTDVAKTFTGIIQALETYQEQIREQGIRLFVRRGGPNYGEGLKKIKAAADKMEIPMEVFGPETHMTAVVKMATDTL